MEINHIIVHLTAAVIDQFDVYHDIRIAWTGRTVLVVWQLFHRDECGCNVLNRDSLPNFCHLSSG